MEEGRRNPGHQSRGTKVGGGHGGVVEEPVGTFDVPLLTEMVHLSAGLSPVLGDSQTSDTDNCAI